MAAQPVDAPWVLYRWLQKISVEPHHTLPTPCWVWLGATTVDSYPRARVDGKIEYLHRYSWQQTNKELLGSQRDGHHRCRNPPCFQPDHIEALSRLENRGPTYIKTKCLVPVQELVALYDLYQYEMQKRGYAYGVDVVQV